MCFAAGVGFWRTLGDLGSGFSTAFGGIRGSIFDGTRGSGGGGGGFSTVTSVFERISGGVSGVTSDVATGSGTGGGGATVTISAGMMLV
jgi:hypothetical protein